MAELLRNIFIEAALHPFLTAAVLILAGWTLLSWRPLQQGVRTFCRHSGRRLLVGVSLLTLVLYLGVVIWYLFLPGFAGELEPMIASVSWLVQHGQPLYHAFDSAERYSVLYGPMSFVTDGVTLQLLGPSILTAKFAHALAAILGLVFFYLALRGVAGWRMALGFTAVAALLYWTEGSFSYMIRPDPFLLLGVSLGLLCAVRAPRVLAILGVAVTLGYCANLKIHAGLFFLPILAVLHRRCGFQAVLWSVLGSILLFWAPFLLHPQISLRNYIVWLREAARHGLHFPTFLTTFQLALFLSLPLLVFALPGFRGVQITRRHRTTIFSLLAATAIVLVLAAKPGAGLNHLLPLIPLVLFLTVELLVEFKRQASDWNLVFSGPRLGVALAVGVAALLAGSVTQYRCVRLIQSQVEGGREIAQDVATILAAYPDQTIGMAYGGEGKDFRLTSYRPLLVYAGQPVLIDVIAVMESDFARRSLPRQTYDAMATGRIAIWLVPRERPPFQKANWYADHNEIFPADFRNLFLASFTCRDRSRFFDLWFHNGLSPEVGRILMGDPSVVLGREDR